MSAAVSKEQPVSLSLCMILRDEEFFLSRCLEAVKGFVDEIVLVDTGSSDNTPGICRQYTDRVFEFPWVDDFAVARNFSLEQARCDWILVLDADELITRQDLQFLRGLIAGTAADAFLLNQLNYSSDLAERDWQPQVGEHPFGWGYPGFRVNPIVRLFRNRPDIRYSGTVHEIINLSDNGIRSVSLDVAIHHDIDGNPGKNKDERQRNYLRIMEDALRQQPNGRLFACAGAVRMYHLEDYRGAIAHLEQAVDLGYERERSLEAIAEARYRLGEHALAQECYAGLYAAGYATASLCNNYSNLLVKTANFALAIEVLERALTLGQPAPERIARIRHNVEHLRRQLGASNSPR